MPGPAPTMLHTLPGRLIRMQAQREQRELRAEPRGDGRGEREHLSSACTASPCALTASHCLKAGRSQQVYYKSVDFVERYSADKFDAVFDAVPGPSAANRTVACHAMRAGLQQSGGSHGHKIIGSSDACRPVLTGCVSFVGGRRSGLRGMLCAVLLLLPQRWLQVTLQTTLSPAVQSVWSPFVKLCILFLSSK